VGDKICKDTIIKEVELALVCGWDGGENAYRLLRGNHFQNYKVLSG
jgi:hypothetical protein